MDPARVRALLTEEGRRLRRDAAAALAAARASAAAGRGAVDGLALTVALRRSHPEAAADLVSDALTQAELAVAARPRLGADADRLLLTRDGLEQATRTAVAARRAQRLAASGVRRVGDLGCGLGLDSLALARAGLDVLAVEVDPATAAAAAANVTLAPGRVRVECADVTQVLGTVLGEVDAAFVDPARRPPGGPRPTGGGRVPAERDPQRWSPSWRWVTDLARRLPRTCAKVAPGVPHDLAPAGAEVEWVSIDGDLVEACVWFAGLAEPGVRRRAVVMVDDATAEQLSVPPETRAPAVGVGAPGAWLAEPDPAVVRAGLVAELAERLGGRLLHPGIAWITADTEPRTALARAHRVVEVLPDDPRALRAALRARGIGSVTVKTRGVATTPEQLRHQLRLGGHGTHGTLVVTRGPDRGIAVLVDPVMQ